VALTTTFIACAPQPAATPAASGNPVAAKPSGAVLKIASPSQNSALGAGAVKISLSYTGPTLVPGAEAKKLDDDMVKVFNDHNVEVVTLTPAEYDAWLKIAEKSSYAEFAKEVPNGKKLIDEALSVK
jgi:hypothetical protein